NATGHATAADILSLEQKIINTVSNRFGIRLEPEVEHIG
ncbi:MAG: UDP-N-acetylenolpyruvoylglucosamine reductase, partial [Paramuribaculum sp.]|nr:UDP-N-acetylenolpyruvoylglucosamine reductase [Paramuribaculum sp.]